MSTTPPPPSLRKLDIQGTVFFAFFLAATMMVIDLQVILCEVENL